MIWTVAPEVPIYAILAITTVLWIVFYLLVLKKPLPANLSNYPVTERGRMRRLLRFARPQNVAPSDFWQRAATFVGIGLLLAYFDYTLFPTFISGLPANSPRQAVYTDYAILGLMVVVGIFFLVSGTLLMLGEGYAILDKRNTIRANKLGSRRKWLEDFNDELYDFENPRDKETQTRAVLNITAHLQSLETNERRTWPDPIRDAILNMVSVIAKGFEPGDITYKRQCASLLRMAYTKRDVFVNSEIVKQFQKSFDNTTEPELNLDLEVILLRQEMHEFQEAFMTSLTDQAIYDWDNERFGRMADHVRYDQLKQRDPPALERIKEHLRTIKQDRQKTQQVRDRATRLLDLAKRV